MVLSEEKISTFDVSMYDLQVMKSFKSSNSLYKIMPYLFFSQFFIAFFIIFDQLKQITVVRHFHDDAKGSGHILEEGILVADNVWVLNACQNSDLIQSALLFFIC